MGTAQCCPQTIQNTAQPFDINPKPYYSTILPTVQWYRNLVSQLTFAVSYADVTLDNKAGKSSFCIKLLENLESLSIETRFDGGILWCYVS